MNSASPSAPARRQSRARATGFVLALLAAAAGAACHRAPSCDLEDKVKLDFTLKDMEGRDVRLASYEGRPLLLNFWATWCGPCKEEIPVLKELAAQYESDVAVLGISVDDTPEDLKKFAEANKINYPLLVGLGQDALLEAYDAQIGIPVSWMIGSNGCPLGKRAGAATREWFADQMKAAS